MLSSKSDYLNDYCSRIDGIRALAVIAVICCHFSEKILPSGYLGVDVFFVISGFVITASLFRHVEDAPLKRFSQFYRRRIKRLLPALVFVVLIGVILMGCFSKQSYPYLKTGTLSLFGLSNLFLYQESIDYWGGAAALNPFTHTWSLGVEEQFYFLYPIIVILFTRKGVTGRNLKGLTLTMVVLAAVSLVSFITFRQEHFSATYFLMPFRFWEMGLGCLVYKLLKLADGKGKLFFERTSVSLTLVALVAIFFTPRDWGLFAPIAAPLLTAFLIAQLVSRTSEFSGKKSAVDILQWSLSQYFGKISYSLYLWHWVVLVVARWTFGVSIRDSPLIVVLILFFSMLSYHFVEQPLRIRKWFGSIGFTAAVVLPIYTILMFFGLAKLQKLKQDVFFLGGRTDPAENLAADFKPIERKSKCKNIRVLGNSHAGHLLPMLNQIGQAHDIEILHKPIGPRGNRGYVSIPSGDGKHMNELGDVLSQLSENDILVISNRNHNLYVNRRGKDWGRINAEEALDVWLLELKVVLEQAALLGVNVVLFLPPPEFHEPVYPELHEKQWFRDMTNVKSIEVSAETLLKRFPEDFYSRLRIFENRYEHFYLFDPKPFLRNPDGDYYVMVNSCMAYKDTHHLSTYGALTLLDPFYSFLARNSLLWPDGESGEPENMEIER
jgi:peptidoglycan/LPS O-acetylase OafA/YrhL